MTVNRVLGLCGEAGSGKDFVFEWLRDRSVFKTVRVAFADEVKYDLQEVQKASLPALFEKPYTDDIRRLLQVWGTDVRRSQDPDYWVDRGMTAVAECFNLTDTELVVVTDVRFQNEADAIRRAPGGGIVARVQASPEVRARRIGPLPPDHPSERIDFTPDYTIPNETNTRGPLFVDFELRRWLGLYSEAA